MSKEIMQQALDAMEKYQVKSGDFDRFDDVIKNLRQALAHPEQDAGKCGCGANLYIDENGKPCSKAQTELVVNEKDGSPCPEFWDWLPKAYNFEGNGTFTKYNMEVAFLAGKNTALAQPEQEPVAWMQDSVELYVNDCPTESYTIPLYTAPPSKPWVGLTGDEINDFSAGCNLGNSVQGAIRKAEAKLKEKNT